MDKKITGILAYIGLIGWLIAYLAGDKEGAKFHLNQGFVLWIASLICAIIPCLGWLCEVILLVLMIMGIISAAKEEEKPLPIIGGINILK